MEIWDVSQGRQSSILTEPNPKKRTNSTWRAQTELAFSANGQTLVARDIAANQRLGMRLRIWTQLASHANLIQIPMSSHVFAVSPDGRLVAGVGKADQAVKKYNGTTTINGASTINVWDTKTGDVVARIPFAKAREAGITKFLAGMVFTPDGKELVVDGHWEKPWRRRLAAFDITPATATPAAATARVIAEDRDSQLPEFESSEMVAALRMSQTAMSFLDGGKTLVTLSGKRDKRTDVFNWQIHYWDMVAGGEQRAAARFITNAFSSDLHVMSPYGDVFAMTIDERHRIRGLIRIVDLATGKTRAEIALRDSISVNSLFVDAAGKYLGAGKSDNRLQVWELGPPQGGDSHQPASTESRPPLLRP